MNFHTKNQITFSREWAMPSAWTFTIKPIAALIARYVGNGSFKGVLFDPPYSNRQISEHYKGLGKAARGLDTSGNFYAKVKSAIAPRIEPNGLAISFCWNSVGFGKKHGFEIVEILLVSHGGSKNDTIVTVERKLQSRSRGQTY
jgi:hypothetical protein